jgi:hypothetical protein
VCGRGPVQETELLELVKSKKPKSSRTIAQVFRDNTNAPVINLADSDNSDEDEGKVEDPPSTPKAARRRGNGVKSEIEGDVKPLFRPSSSSDDERQDQPPPSSQTSVDFVLRRNDFQSS